MTENNSTRDQIIVDIRSKSLFKEGTIPGAINIPMDRINELYELPMDRKICLLCHIGEISDELALLMKDAGYDAYSYPGGYLAYLEQEETFLEEENLEIVYADNASTTAMSEGVLEAYTEAVKFYGNPSTLHREAGKIHIISDSIEHHAILHTLKRLEEEGFKVTLLEPDSDGIISPESVAAAITEETGLVSIMYANNEIGTIEPIREIGEICKSRGILFHTDAVQAAGHIEIDVKRDNIDMMSLSAHKFHGPRGVGLLYVRRGIMLPEFISGGGQEMGMRAGTENLPGIAGLTAALRESVEEMESKIRDVTGMRERLVSELRNLPGAVLNGHPERRLPGNVNFSFSNPGNINLLMELDARGICVSAGSACSASDSEPSHVLTAIGRSPEEARNSIRITIDEYNTPEEIETIIRTIREIYAG